MKKIVVLGAGISGLAVAWFLKQKFGNRIELSILEKERRAGGWIRTLHQEGFLFEGGPRGFSPRGKGSSTLALVKEIGLENALIASDKGASTRYIYEGGKLHPFSFGFLLRKGIVGAALHDLFTPRATVEDETIASFIERRFNRRLAEGLIDPLTKGIYGGDAQKLSIRSCFPLLWNYEQQKGSVLRGFLTAAKQKKPPAALYSFKEGMEILPKRLAEKLENHLILNKSVNSLDEIEADCVISTLPTHSLAPLLPCEDPFEYTTLSLVHLGWNRTVMSTKGYGFLVPTKEKGDILGMTWDSQIFPKQNSEGQTRLCIMVAGAHSEETLHALALKNVSKYLGISSPPTVLLTTVAERAIPHYTVGHHKRVESFKMRMPPRLLAIGTCFEGVGLNDCIFKGQKLIEGLSF